MSLKDWAANTRKDAVEWSSVLSEAASNPRIVEIFLQKKLGEWKSVVENRFDSNARKKLVGIKNKNLRSQILRAVVSIKDLTRSIEEKVENPEGVEDTMLRIRAELDRLAKNIDKLAAGNPEIKRALKETSSGQDGPPVKKRKTIPPPLPASSDDPRKKEISQKEVSQPVSNAQTDREVRGSGSHPVSTDTKGTNKEEDIKEKKKHLSVPEDFSPPEEKPKDDEDSFAEEVVSDDQVIEEMEVEKELADHDSAVGEAQDKPLESEPVVEEEPVGFTARDPENGSLRPETHEVSGEELEIQSVDLLKDADVLEEPVIRLTKKRGESVPGYKPPKPAPTASGDPVPVEPHDTGSKKRMSLDALDPPGAQDVDANESTPGTKPRSYVAEDARLTLLELYLKSLRSQENLQVEQMLTLDQVVTILGGSLAGKTEELSARISRLDRLYTSSGEPGIHENFPAEWKRIPEDLCRTMMDTLHNAWNDASPAGLDLLTGDPTVLDSASELPIVKLERSLRLNLSRWKLPGFLNRLWGPAVCFSCSIKAKKGIPLSRPVPENRLEFSLVAETEGVYIQALHLLEPGEELPLGIAADPGIHAGGVFFQILLPHTFEGKNIDQKGETEDGVRQKGMAGRFAVSETSRFLRHLEKHPGR